MRNKGDRFSYLHLERSFPLGVDIVSQRARKTTLFIVSLNMTGSCDLKSRLFVSTRTCLLFLTRAACLSLGLFGMFIWQM